VLASTSVGQNIYVVGSVSALGSWDISKAIKLDAGRYRSDLPLWYGSVTLPAGAAFEYKYIRKDGSGNVAWESDPNRAYTVPKTCRTSAALKDTWR
jgi:glucoamylase